VKANHVCMCGDESGEEMKSYDNDGEEDAELEKFAAASIGQKGGMR
jgi:hypothetical protein